MAQIAGLSLAEVRTRRAHDHYPYVARIEAMIVGYGWLAAHTAKAGFREVGHICLMPGGGVGLSPTEEPSRAASGAALLGLPRLPPARGIGSSA